MAKIRSIFGKTACDEGEVTISTSEKVSINNGK